MSNFKIYNIILLYMNIAHRDQLLEHLKSEIHHIDVDMQNLEKIFKQKGGNKYVQSVHSTFKQYKREKEGGKKRESDAMHSIVAYLDQQISNSDDPHLRKRARFGRRCVLEQIRGSKK